MEKTFASYGPMKSLEFLDEIFGEIPSDDVRKARKVIEKVNRGFGTVDRVVPDSEPAFKSWSLLMMRRQLLELVDMQGFENPRVLTTMRNYVAARYRGLKDKKQSI